MSSNKKLKTSFNDIKGRQSFDERICDDLSEVILQYLPLEDKLRLECVSKQFQRTVFQKQHDLNLEQILYKDEDEYEDEDEDVIQDLMAVLKKCPNIGFVDCDGVYGWLCQRIFQLIINLCHNLNEINWLCDDSDHQMSAEFTDKLGSKLISLSVSENIPKFVNRFTNLRILKVSKGLYLSDICGLDLKMLKQLVIQYTDKDVYNLETFVDNYKSLTHITITVEDCDSKEINYLLRQMLRLKNLVHFDVDTSRLVEDDADDSDDFSYGIGLNDISFADSVQQMTVIWPKLKSFGCYLTADNTAEDLEEMFPTFTPIRGFNQLKRFTLWIDYELPLEDMVKLLGHDFIKSLTHLKICQRDIDFIEDSVIDDIRQRFPRLKVVSQIIDSNE